jgi:hypothetical protein
MAVRCIECGEQDRPLRIVPASYCEHRVCLGFRRPDCSEIHRATCPIFCEAVGRKPQPHPRDLAKQAEQDAKPQQLDLFG